MTVIKLRQITRLLTMVVVTAALPAILGTHAAACNRCSCFFNCAHCCKFNFCCIGCDTVHQCCGCAAASLLPAAFANEVPSVALQSVSITGNGVTQNERTELTNELRAGQYRPSVWAQEVQSRVLDLWRQHGYFRVVLDMNAKLLPSTAKQALSATFKVNAGPQYRLAGFRWTGSTVFSPAELNSMMPINSGEVFNTAKIRHGLNAIMAAYSGKGYADARPVPEETFDETSRLITLTINMEEGKQGPIPSKIEQSQCDDGDSVTRTASSKPLTGSR